MDEGKGKSLTLLKELSQIDVSIARIRAERNKFEKGIADSAKTLTTLEAEIALKSKELTDSKRKYEREEKFLQAESEKLVNRRKSVATLGDYKTQQAASREIEAASKQLESQEDLLLNQMEVFDKLQSEIDAKTEVLKKQQAEVDEQNAGSAEFLSNLKQREDEKKSAREKIAATLDKEFLRRYAIIYEKFPMDPITEVKGKQCGICRMSIPPQLLVKAARGQSLEQCPGCHRIVYLEPQVPNNIVDNEDAKP